jgi:hypothetical protein
MLVCRWSSARPPTSTNDICAPPATAKFTGEKDSLAEGKGFEPSVPLARDGAGSAEREQFRGDKRARSLNRSYLEAGPRVRIRLPPAESLPNFGSDVVFTRAGKEEASAKDKSMHRGLGSIDFTAACRSVLKVGFDPNDADKRVVTHAKSNLAAPRTIAGLNPQGRPVWLGGQVIALSRGLGEREARHRLEPPRPRCEAGPVVDVEPAFGHKHHAAPASDIGDRAIITDQKTIGP